MHVLPEALAPLGQYRQFITYLVVPKRDGSGKSDKFPTDWRTGEVRDAHDPAIWTDFATAAASGRPVGFVFTEQDPFYFVDIDNALQDGVWSAIAVQLCQAFAGAAIEVSQSGKGLHIFGAGPLPVHGSKNKALGLELYHSRRFVALTGINAIGSAAWRHDEAAAWLAASYFPPVAGGVDTDDEITDAPRADWRGPADDEELLRRAMQSSSAKAAFGSGATFADLWTANEEVLARAYPTSGDGPYDRSSADAALAQHLAFWTGAHGTRVERLMRRSALVREKWDQHRTYMLLTVRSSCARQVDVLKDKPPQFELEPATPFVEVTANSPVAPAPGVDSVDLRTPRQVAVEGSTFLGAEQQAELFKGCVYVSDVHAVLVPGGELLQPDRFKVRFGGYTFGMDNANERTSRDAWEAFTQSQVLRPVKADTTCFRPELAPGAIISSGGRRKVNIWWEIAVPRTKGNPQKLLSHVAKILPDERDAKIVLSFMAACVQHKGIKFQWAPLIQGVEGNGKSFLTECVVNAVGERYTHLPRADQISAQFNPWVRNKLVIGVEDVFVPDQKQETFEILKPMITARRLPIEGKGVDQVMADVCCNWILNSNHQAGLRKTENDRRIAPLFCAQQDKADLKRDGLIGPYFEDLYHWYRHGGMAVVNEFLATYEIDPDFNPASGQIAPMTSSTHAAIEAGRGTAEQHVLEAIETDMPGFKAGWVSSLALDKLLERHGLSKRIAPNRRRALMKGLGYDWHPKLTEGRVNNIVAPDNAKVRLYIKVGSALAQLGTAAEVAHAYTKAQAVD